MPTYGCCPSPFNPFCHTLILGRCGSSTSISWRSRMISTDQAHISLLATVRGTVLSPGRPNSCVGGGWCSPECFRSYVPPSCRPALVPRRLCWGQAASSCCALWACAVWVRQLHPQRAALYQQPDKDPRLARDLVGNCSSKVGQRRGSHSCLAERLGWTAKGLCVERPCQAWCGAVPKLAILGGGKEFL